MQVNMAEKRAGSQTASMRWPTGRICGFVVGPGVDRAGSGSVEFREQVLQIQRVRDHLDLAVGGARPLVAGLVPVEFDAVPVRIAQVDGFADAVVAGAFDRDVRALEAAQGVRQFPPVRIQDGDVVQPRRSRRGRLAARALQADVVVIAARRQEGGLAAVSLRDLEAQDAVVKGDGAFQVGHLQMHVTDSRLGMDRHFLVLRIPFPNGIDRRT